MYAEHLQKISDFWHTHFHFEETTIAVAKHTVFNFFSNLYGNTVNYRAFTALSGIVGIKTKKTRKGKLFLAMPISTAGKRLFKVVANNRGDHHGDGEIRKGEAGPDDDAGEGRCCQGR